jgi:hypothetical protein
MVTAAAGTVSASRPASAPSPLLTLGIGFGPELAPFTIPPELAPFWSREAAMSSPTVSRARDLHVSAVSALPFTFWATSRDAGVDPRPLPLPAWAERPDPMLTRQHILGWTTDDLFFYGLAHWRIIARGADTWPTAFRRILPGELHEDRPGEFRVGDVPVDERDLVTFRSPLEGILANGWRAISIALALDAAAERFADTEVPAGVIQERDHSGEDLSREDLTLNAETFAAARRSNVIAALNRYLEYVPVNWDASAMQLVEGRTYQALELARLANVPGYLVGAPAGTGMTYLNAQQAREDLITFGSAPLIGCIEQTLSGPNVTERGHAVVLDQTAWLRNPFTEGEPNAAPPPPSSSSSTTEEQTS